MDQVYQVLFINDNFFEILFCAWIVKVAAAFGCSKRILELPVLPRGRAEPEWAMMGPRFCAKIVSGASLLIPSALITYHIPSSILYLRYLSRYFLVSQNTYLFRFAKNPLRTMSANVGEEVIKDHCHCEFDAKPFLTGVISLLGPITSLIPS